MLYLIKIDKDVFKSFLGNSIKLVPEKLLNLNNSKNNYSFILTEDKELIAKLNNSALQVIPINKSILINIKNIENLGSFLNKDSPNLKQGLVMVDSDKYLLHPGLLGSLETDMGYINVFSYSTSYKNNKITDSLSIQSTNSNTNFNIFTTKSGFNTRVLCYDKVSIYSNVFTYPFRTLLSHLYTFSVEEKIDIVTQFGKKSHNSIYLNNNLLSLLALQNNKNNILMGLDKNFSELDEWCESIILANNIGINKKQLMGIIIKFNNHRKYYDASFIYYDTDIVGSLLRSQLHSFSFLNIDD